jgi:hypothetical protein
MPAALSRWSFRVFALTALVFAFSPRTFAQGGARLIAQIPVPSNSCCESAANPNLNKVYVAGGASGGQQISMIDGASFSLITVGVGSGPAVDTVTNNYWAAGVFGGNAIVYSGSSNAQIQSVSLGFCPVNVAADPLRRRMWVGAQCGGGNDPVWAIDADRFLVVAGPIGSGGVMGPIVVNTATGVAYLRPSGISERLDPSSFALTKNSFGVVYGSNPVTNLLYAVPNLTTLQVLDGSTSPETILNTVSLSFNIAGENIGVNTALNHIYVGDQNGIVHILDGSTNNLNPIATVSLGAGIGIGSIVADSARGRVYVATASSIGDSMFVIQESAATTTTLTSSANPSDVGDPITFTATVTSANGTPNGSITLSDGSTVLATLPSPFPAVFSTSSLVAGSHNITAQFTPADPTSFAPSNSSLMETIISLSQLPLLSGNNTFTGNQLINGTVTASSFFGNGSGLTNVTASGLACAGCIGNTQLGISYAAGDAQGGNALNALMFGGLPPGAFAPASGSGIYVAKAGDTMTGTLNLPANGLVAGTNQLVLSGGNVGIGTVTPQAALDVAGLGSFSSSTNAAGTAIVHVQQSGAPTSANFTIDLTKPILPQLPPTAIHGDATAITNFITHGLTGTSMSTNGRGVVGFALSTTGETRGVNALSLGDSGEGLTAFELSPTGNTLGIYASSASPQGIGAQFENTAGGQILSGLNNGVEKFRVDGNGNVTATSFFGNGAGLTNVVSTTATTASSLNCTGCVGNTQLGVNYAGSASQGGPAATALSALQSNNALALGGIGPSGYAPATGSTAYVAKAGDTMTGNLTLPTLNASGTVSASGSLVVGNGTPILQHTSILVNPSFLALKPGACTTQNFTLTGAADGDTIALGVPNERMTGGGSLIYTAWVSAADTVTVQACNANASSPQKTAGTGSIRIDLWKH